MKILMGVHIITAVLIWVLVAIVAGNVISYADNISILATLCLLGIATLIAVMDILSAYFIQKGRTSLLPKISAVFWGIMVVPCFINIFFWDESNESRIVFAILTITALIKIGVLVSLLKIKTINEIFANN
jgi:hypothetical protein